MVRRPWRGGYDEGKKKKGATARKMWARHTGQSIWHSIERVFSAAVSSERLSRITWRSSVDINSHFGCKAEDWQ